MKTKILYFAGLMLAATAGQVEAGGVLSLNYVTTDIGGGQFKYDFELSVTNQDNSYSLGQNFNWIIFGDANQSVSPISDFAFISDTFPNPSMLYSTSSGFHNGPTFMDFTNFGSTAGWVPLGVGDSVSWSGTSSHNVTSGLLFSTLSSSGTNSSFEAAYYGLSSPVPEPASLAMWGLGAIGMMVTRRRRKQQSLAA